MDLEQRCPELCLAAVLHPLQPGNGRIRLPCVRPLPLRLAGVQDIAGSATAGPPRPSFSCPSSWMPVSLQNPSLLGASAHTARVPHPRRTSPACGAPRPRRQASREPPRSAVNRPRSPHPDSVILDRISAPSRDPELARSFPLLEQQDKRPPGRDTVLQKRPPKSCISYLHNHALD
uniref:Uncharacterized protein n=1 Tax=Aegilops tauschii TaxID=37682 RepID=M8C549_AEGTA